MSPVQKPVPPLLMHHMQGEMRHEKPHRNLKVVGRCEQSSPVQSCTDSAIGLPSACPIHSLTFKSMMPFMMSAQEPPSCSHSDVIADSTSYASDRPDACLLG